MGHSLIIVESPAKARSMHKYLGSEFTALASYGHVMDLLPKKGSVDPDDDFAMHYSLIERNEKHLNAIIRAAKNIFNWEGRLFEENIFNWEGRSLFNTRKGRIDNAATRCRNDVS
jgi:DNA topoisomerase-1